MILDIRFTHRSPEQIQRVRMATLYFRFDRDSLPEIVIHSYDNVPQRNIDISHIDAITITND